MTLDGESAEYGACGMLPSGTPSTDVMLDPIKSRLSVSYIGVLCSYLDLGWNEPFPSNDRSGWDIHIEPVVMRSEWEEKPELYIQLKSTSVPVCHDGYISYKLDVDTYRELCRSGFKDRSILALLCLDDDTTKWVETSAECLIMRRAMYWYKIEKEKVISDDQRTVTVRIP